MKRIGINGFGRIGRTVFRLLQERKEEFEIVGINDLMDPKTLSHLLKYDSTRGKFKGIVETKDNSIIVDGKEIKVSSTEDPAKIQWKELGAEYIIESTGVFKEKKQIMKHIEAGAEKVILTVPAKDDVDNTIILGINDNQLKAEDKIVSNSSCTTNCLAPIAKILNDKFGIVRGYMNTIHSYTNDQRILDFGHRDLRRARTAGQNIIPTTTGAAISVTKVLPELKGKLQGISTRVPIQDGSLLDFTVELEKNTTIKEINSSIKEVAESKMKGILEYCTDPIVSSDIIGNPHSSIFDSLSTMVINGNFVKILTWYDNEFGYSNRVVDLAIKMAKM
ncbi:MAG: type I glyceraldehyde-3-phosphate dehydrogenase [Candidatus Cloacimonadota bacterium]|nr:MAG: type I glyceraldehyde-3-phosphate dehydrogenase [Candidatus Cloacimonadota bacterium]PIE78933.1 MAG: type I glyceraldehyde-3-phosphate dehydrogenase [Candidatus Delongbacteria bacterium]